MKHLGDRVSDLVDNRLDHDERDRALGHLAICELCRTEVELERTARAALRAMPSVEPSEKLYTTLLAIAEPGGPLPAEGPSQSAETADAVGVAGWREHTPMPKQSRFPMPARGVRYAAAGVLGAGAVVTMLAALGGEPSSEAEPPAAVVPPTNEFSFEHARSTGTLPFTEPASFLMTPSQSQDAGW